VTQLLTVAGAHTLKKLQGAESPPPFFNPFWWKRPERAISWLLGKSSAKHTKIATNKCTRFGRRSLFDWKRTGPRWNGNGRGNSASTREGDQRHRRPRVATSIPGLNEFRICHPISARAQTKKKTHNVRCGGWDGVLAAGRSSACLFERPGAARHGQLAVWVPSRVMRRVGQSSFSCRWAEAKNDWMRSTRLARDYACLRCNCTDPCVL